MRSARLLFSLRALAQWSVWILVFNTNPSWAQSEVVENINAQMAMGMAPLIIGFGALTFAVVAVIWLLRARKASAHIATTGQNQVAQMRAELDEYDAVMACMPEVTLLWRAGSDPQMYGRPQILGEKDLGLVEILNYERWLNASEAVKLASGINHLHSGREEFSISLTTKSGQHIRAMGRTTRDTSVVRLRKATARPPQSQLLNDQTSNVQILQSGTNNSQVTNNGILSDAKAILSTLSEPAWLCDTKGNPVFANAAYSTLCDALNIVGKEGKITNLVSPQQIIEFSQPLTQGKTSVHIGDPMPGKLSNLVLVISNISGELFCRLANLISDASSTSANGMVSTLSPVMEAMSDPMVVFDRKGLLTQYNGAYVALFSFEQSWLTPGLNERAVIDHLRRNDQLPVVPDYRKWRTEHLQSYGLTAPRHDVWHLRDGRTLEITATPNIDAGGVIYRFCDVSEQLRLQSSNKAMLNVQSETLNSLSEGVAVFGTDGRLRLHNPQLSQIWKLPLNGLGQNPHIDQIALFCGKSVPEDGEEIWQKLKPSVIDLDPNRRDTSGRIQRKDGVLIDYTIVRLADSQTMLTFMDVTQSANYENVLKERNDALVTADRLKDAFVQNVSYELRSPLTSIIGFADLLATDNSAPLSDQQRAYTDYIRSSSATLGVLIDSILDLTNVDAGIAELDLKEQDIEALIEKAKAGFGATLVAADGAQPLNLNVTMPSPMPKFEADGARVVQILYNLLSNAAKFSEPGAAIALDVSAHGEWIRFCVEDEGIGVPKDLQETQDAVGVGKTVNGFERGAGIGFLIVKAFVELHHGKIVTETNGSGGSRVVVDLPANATPIETATAANA